MRQSSTEIAENLLSDIPAYKDFITTLIAEALDNNSSQKIYWEAWFNGATGKDLEDADKGIVYTPLLLDPEDFTIKVISISKKSILPATFEQLKNYPTYEDKLISEDLYSCAVKEDILCKEFLNAKVSAELEAIQTLCNEHNASYFRIVES